MDNQGKPTGHWLTRTCAQSRRQRRRQTVPTVMHYCLLTALFVKN